MAKRASAADVASKLGLAAGSEEAARKLFAKFDKDGSGSIAKDELLKIIKKLMPDLTLSQCETVFSVIDVDHNLSVDYNEFVAWALSGCATLPSRKSLAQRLDIHPNPNVEERLKQLFKKFDVDNSGTISKKELSSILKVLLPDLDRESRHRFFERGDKDKRGQINYEEFVKCLFEGSDNYNVELDDLRPASEFKNKRIKAGPMKLDPATIFFSCRTIPGRFQIVDGTLAGQSLQQVVAGIEAGELEYLKDLPMIEVVYFQDHFYARGEIDNRILYVLQTCFSGDKLIANVNLAPAKFSVKGDGMNVNVL
eukprot:TRINITY_DN28894_c0_g1_i1.p1 TRINITY_DN28894_c0_g1~~TRINITY_DN28894_c0_g1_i1.p1  ORF type:complete len:317 (+),score=53.63 TRINITY_DN28894_c0_g1_i1:24-953(+)